MARLRLLLMVLIAVRLLMPPGICACKWASPAGRLLVALLQTQRQLPDREERDDDHAPGCPASPLAVGMGVKPASEPVLPPAPSPEPVPSLESAQAAPSLPAEATPSLPFDSPPEPLYLTLRTFIV